MNLSVNDDGVYNSETYTVSCEEAVLAGKAAASLKDHIITGYDKDCQTCFHALASGILSSGKSLWNVGVCTVAQLLYSVRKTGADCGIFIENCCGNKKLNVYSSDGHILTLDEEKAFSEALNKSRFLPECSSEGVIKDDGVITDMYFSEMKKMFHSAGNSRIEINSSSGIIKKFAEGISGKSGSPETVVFNIPGNGLKASAYSFETGCVFWEKLILICCTDEFEKGKDVALPDNFPVIAEKIASAWNRTVYRFNPLSSNLSDISKKEMSLEFPFLTDGLYLAARIAWIMHTRCCSLSGLLMDIPEFTTTVKYVSMHSNPDSTIQNLQKDEVCCCSDSGRIIARKSKTGKSLILHAESYSTETADELCSTWINELNI